MDKLEKWYNQFKDVKKMKFDEAKQSYIEALKIIDEKERLSKIDEIAIQTIHVIYKYLKNNDIQMYKSGSFDIDDIISCYSENWIKYIREGSLLKSESLSSILNRIIVNHTKDIVLLTVTKNNDGSTIFNKGLYEKYFNYYINMKNENYELTFEDFLKSFYKIDDISYIPYFEIEDAVVIFNYCQILYDELHDKETEELNIVKTRVSQYLELMIDMITITKLDDNMAAENEIDTNFMKEQLKKVINELLLSLDERERKVLKLRYGLEDGKRYNLEQVGNVFNISRERVRQIESKSLRKLRRPYRIEKLEPYVD